MASNLYLNDVVLLERTISGGEGVPNRDNSIEKINLAYVYWFW